jgi:hypothetical protein
MEERKSETEKLRALADAIVEDPQKRKAFFFEPNNVAREYCVEFTDEAVQSIKESRELKMKTLEKKAATTEFK